VAFVDNRPDVNFIREFDRLTHISFYLRLP
jgi:hypothetical protein